MSIRVGVLVGLMSIAANVQGEVLVVAVSERCAPLTYAGRGGGLDVFAKGKQVLRIEGLCAGNPPVRVWRDGNDRAFTCGREPNPLTSTEPIQTIKYVRIGKC